MMEGTQRFALTDGTVGVNESFSAANKEQKEATLQRAFSGFANAEYDLEDADGKLKEVILRDSDDTDYRVKYAIKAVSGGGRPAMRPDELRIQIDPAISNELYEENRSGGIGLILGVYDIDGKSLLVVWRPWAMSASEKTISKQVSAQSVAKAFLDGISLYVNSEGAKVYAMQPELFRGYLNVFMPAGNEPGVQEATKRESDNKDPHNLIYFGAPGTGKSFQLNQRATGDKEKGIQGRFDEDKIRRVTFYPDYTYAQFVGGYKPVMEGDDIRYDFVPGPFIKTYMDAATHPDDDYLLIVEEINRANPAGVFGDTFQLLDRNTRGTSNYYIFVPEEMSAYIKKQLDGLSPEERQSIEAHYDPDMDFQEYSDSILNRLSLPPNMYIWATMNSADQGVFPMDTAFKRRWSFRYIGIDEGEHVIERYEIPLGNTGNRAKWNDFRKEINRLLLKERVNEDKLLGPFFIDPDLIQDDDSFTEAFKSKVLLYLIEDAAKTKTERIFTGNEVTYSKVSENFDKEGEDIFNGISLRYTNEILADDTVDPAEEPEEADQN